MKNIFFSKKSVQTSLRQNVDSLRSILLPCYFNPYPKQIYLNHNFIKYYDLRQNRREQMRPDYHILYFPFSPFFTLSPPISILSGIQFGERPTWITEFEQNNISDYEFPDAGTFHIQPSISWWRQPPEQLQLHRQKEITVSVFLFYFTNCFSTELIRNAVLKESHNSIISHTSATQLQSCLHY